MESNCCGASEWIEDTGICGSCKEHADWDDIEEELIDTRWVLLEEGNVYMVLLTKEQAEIQKQIMQNKFPHLSYTLFYDEYYEYTDIINEN